MVFFYLRLHLGVYYENDHKISVNDCDDDEFYEMFRDISKSNTKAYEEVFKCIPSDCVKTFSELEYFLNSSNLAQTDPQKVITFFSWS